MNTLQINENDENEFLNSKFIYDKICPLYIVVIITLLLWLSIGLHIGFLFFAAVAFVAPNLCYDKCKNSEDLSSQNAYSTVCRKNKFKEIPGENSDQLYSRLVKRTRLYALCFAALGISSAIMSYSK